MELAKHYRSVRSVHVGSQEARKGAHSEKCGHGEIGLKIRLQHQDRKKN